VQEMKLNHETTSRDPMAQLIVQCVLNGQNSGSLISQKPAQGIVLRHVNLVCSLFHSRPGIIFNPLKQ
jgi:hypothetical protein